MKRLLIWLVILVTPTLAWFAFTESGRGAWRASVFADKHATMPAVTSPESPLKSDGGRTPQTIVLIPARPAPTEPALRVQVGGRRTVGQGHNKLMVGLIVTDPQGRRSGIDTFNNATYQEISDSKAERIAGRESSGNEFESIVVTIKPAASTIYSLEITGNPGGEYNLAVGGVSPTLQSVTSISQDRAVLNTSVHYTVDLTKIKSHPFPGRGGMTARTLNPSEEFVGAPETRVKVSSYDTLQSVCERAYEKLSQVRGGKLERRNEFALDGRRFDGCMVSLSGHKKTVTGDWSPHFLYPYEGSEMYYRGWKSDSEADGHDGTSYRIHSPSLFCLVTGSWDGGVDGESNHSLSDGFNVTVECAAKPANFH